MPIDFNTPFLVDVIFLNSHLGAFDQAKMPDCRGPVQAAIGKG